MYHSGDSPLSTFVKHVDLSNILIMRILLSFFNTKYLRFLIMRHLSLSHHLYRLRQFCTNFWIFVILLAIMQAVPLSARKATGGYSEGIAPFLQLPHFSEAVIKKIARKVNRLVLDNVMLEYNCLMFTNNYSVNLSF